MTPPQGWVAVIGDRVEGHLPQESIEPAIRHAARCLDLEPPEVRWVETKDIVNTGPGLLNGAIGVFGAPGGPFASIDGALDGIRWAREGGVPFLGTCGGFQLGVVEFARNVLGRTNATHAEYDGATNDDDLFIDELLCSLVGQTMKLRILDPEMTDWYGTSTPEEQYYCRFGLSPRWQEFIEDAGLRCAAADQSDGNVRVLRLETHPFFVLTLFVPQVRSTAASPHPIITRFVATARNGAGSPGSSRS